VVAKRSNGVKTRSMINTNEVVLAPRAPAASGAFSSAAPTARETFARGLAMADPNSYQVTGTADDIDARDMNDPLCATAYVSDMYQYFKEKELTTAVKPTYMESQPHINSKMRAILVDWLIEVHGKFKLVPETLYLTISIIDRYLHQEAVTRPKLQLIGVTALLIASKFEEIYPPELRDLVYICDRAYTRTEIVDCETTMLKALAYNVSVPSPHAFLVRYLKAGHADKRIVQIRLVRRILLPLFAALARTTSHILFSHSTSFVPPSSSCFLLDSTLQSYNLLQYIPSQLAAATVFIARRHVGRNGW